MAVVLAACVGTAIAVAAGAGHSASSPRLLAGGQAAGTKGLSPIVGNPAAAPKAPAAKPTAPALVVRAPHAGPEWSTVALVHGRPAAWIAQRGAVTLMRFDQRAVRLDLHAGSSDGGVTGWRYGDQISPSEIHHVIAAFNGGFKLTYADVGFLSGGHVAVPLKDGLASIVTYTNETTAIGAWGEGVPSAGLSVYSVLQNQRLLVDHGQLAASAASCVIECWGETIGGATSVARSALGITADGQLVWAAGEPLLPSQLGAAMVRAGVVRALELDINPDWVAGYLYVHRPTGPEAIQATPGQIGIAGKFLEPYSRDFLAVLARG
jgi:hypothetical protein